MESAGADYASMTLPETLLGDEDLAARPDAGGDELYVDERALADTAAALRRIGADAGESLSAHCAEIERLIAGTPLPFMHQHMMSYVELMRGRYNTAVTRIEHAATALDAFTADTRGVAARGARLLTAPREDVPGL